MKTPCPNSTCQLTLTGPKSAIGTRVACSHCGFEFIWTDCFHSTCSFVIYDLETTGLYPDQDEFIQIAAVRYENGCLVAGKEVQVGWRYLKSSRSGIFNGFVANS